MLGGGTQQAVEITADVVNAVLPGVGTAIAAVGSLLDQNGPKKIAATGCANNTQFACEALVREWNNFPPNMKTRSLQTQYLNASLELWKYLEQCCNQPQLGSAGVRCISERDHGGIYDYWPGCYNVILNDPQVYDGITSNGQVIQPSSIVNPITGTSSLVSYVEQHPYIDMGIGLLILLLIL